MQAYATAERSSSGAGRRSSHPESTRQDQLDQPGGLLDSTLLDGLLSRLADLVVDRLRERTALTDRQRPEGWMDARGAADYLGVHRDTLRKLAAERIVPVHQDGPGCKLYFRQDELDDWRRSSKAVRGRLRAVS